MRKTEIICDDDREAHYHYAMIATARLLSGESIAIVCDEDACSGVSDMIRLFLEYSGKPYSEYLNLRRQKRLLFFGSPTELNSFRGHIILDKQGNVEFAFGCSIGSLLSGYSVVYRK